MNHISLRKAGLCIQSHLQTHTLDASRLYPMYLYCCLYTVAYSDWPTVFAIVCWQSSELFFPSSEAVQQACIHSPFPLASSPQQPQKMFPILKATPKHNTDNSYNKSGCCSMQPLTAGSTMRQKQTS